MPFSTIDAWFKRRRNRGYLSAVESFNALRNQRSSRSGSPAQTGRDPVFSVTTETPQFHVDPEVYRSRQRQYETSFFPKHDPPPPSRFDMLSWRDEMRQQDPEVLAAQQGELGVGQSVGGWANPFQLQRGPGFPFVHQIQHIDNSAIPFEYGTPERIAPRDTRWPDFLSRHPEINPGEMYSALEGAGNAREARADQLAGKEGGWAWLEERIEDRVRSEQGRRGSARRGYNRDKEFARIEERVRNTWRNWLDPTTLSVSQLEDVQQFWQLDPESGNAFMMPPKPGALYRTDPFYKEFLHRTRPDLVRESGIYDEDGPMGRWATSSPGEAAGEAYYDKFQQDLKSEYEKALKDPTSREFLQEQQRLQRVNFEEQARNPVMNAEVETFVRGKYKEARDYLGRGKPKEALAALEEIFEVRPYEGEAHALEQRALADLRPEWEKGGWLGSGRRDKKVLDWAKDVTMWSPWWERSDPWTSTRTATVPKSEFFSVFDPKDAPRKILQGESLIRKSPGYSQERRETGEAPSRGYIRPDRYDAKTTGPPLSVDELIRLPVGDPLLVSKRELGWLEGFVGDTSQNLMEMIWDITSGVASIPELLGVGRLPVVGESTIKGLANYRDYADFNAAVMAEGVSNNEKASRQELREAESLIDVMSLLGREAKAGSPRTLWRLVVGMMPFMKAAGLITSGTRYAGQAVGLSGLKGAAATTKAATKAATANAARLARAQQAMAWAGSSVAKLRLSPGAASKARQFASDAGANLDNWLFAGFGEGVISGGMALNQMREAAGGETTPQALNWARASGFGVGVLGGVFNRLSRKWGIHDWDDWSNTMSKARPEKVKSLVDDAASLGAREFARLNPQYAPASFGPAVVMGAKSAGMEGMEEFGQSLWEQLADNIAGGRDMWEGTSQAAFLGFVTGAISAGGRTFVNRAGRDGLEVAVTDDFVHMSDDERVEFLRASEKITSELREAYNNLTKEPADVPSLTREDAEKLGQTRLVDVLKVSTRNTGPDGQRVPMRARVEQGVSILTDTLSELQSRVEQGGTQEDRALNGNNIEIVKEALAFGRQQLEQPFLPAGDVVPDAALTETFSTKEESDRLWSLQKGDQERPVGNATLAFSHEDSDGTVRSFVPTPEYFEQLLRENPDQLKETSYADVMAHEAGFHHVGNVTPGEGERLVRNVRDLDASGEVDSVKAQPSTVAYYRLLKADPSFSEEEIERELVAHEIGARAAAIQIVNLEAGDAALEEQMARAEAGSDFGQNPTLMAKGALGMHVVASVPQGFLRRHNTNEPIDNVSGLEVGDTVRFDGREAKVLDRQSRVASGPGRVKSTADGSTKLQFNTTIQTRLEMMDSGEEVVVLAWDDSLNQINYANTGDVIELRDHPGLRGQVVSRELIADVDGVKTLTLTIATDGGKTINVISHDRESVATGRPQPDAEAPTLDSPTISGVGTMELIELSRYILTEAHPEDILEHFPRVGGLEPDSVAEIDPQHKEGKAAKDRLKGIPEEAIQSVKHIQMPKTFYDLFMNAFGKRGGDRYAAFVPVAGVENVANDYVALPFEGYAETVWGGKYDDHITPLQMMIQFAEAIQNQTLLQTHRDSELGGQSVSIQDLLGKAVEQSDINAASVFLSVVGRQLRHAQTAEFKLSAELAGTRYTTPDGTTVVEETDPMVVASIVAHELGHVIDWISHRKIERNQPMLKKLQGLAGVQPFFVERNKIKNKKIEEELTQLSMLWTPWNPATSSDGYNSYRMRASERYAQAMSVMLVMPEVAETVAPTFFKEFFNTLDKKKSFKDSWNILQNVIHGAPPGHPSALNAQGRLDERQIELTIKDYETISDNSRKVYEELAKLRQLFPGDTVWEKLKGAVRNPWIGREFYDLFVDRHGKIIRNHLETERRLKKKGRSIPDEMNPLFLLSSKPYLSGVIKGYLLSNFQSMATRLDRAGISWHLFGAIVQYEAIRSGGREGVWSPRGATMERAESLLNTVNEGLTPDQREVIKDALRQFDKATWEVTERAYNEGFWSQSFYDLLKERRQPPAEVRTISPFLDTDSGQFYATFKSYYHQFEETTPLIERTQGMIEPSSNVATETMIKMAVTLQAIERNKIKRNVVNYFAQHFPNSVVVPSKGDRLPVLGQKVKEGTPIEREYNPTKEVAGEIVGTKTTLKAIVFKENGYSQVRYVEEYIHASLSDMPSNQLKTLFKILSTPNSKVFRPAFTVMNPGFMSVNLFRDFFRGWKAESRKGRNLSLYQWFRFYLRGHGIARTRAFGQKQKRGIPFFGVSRLFSGKLTEAQQEKAEQDLNDLYKALSIKALAITYNDQMLGDEGEYDASLQTLHRFGIDINSVEGRKKMWSEKFFGSFFNMLKKSGDYIETLPKAAALLHAAESVKGDISQISAEDVNYIRTRIGSPDFLAGGLATRWSNQVLLFSNAMIQGWRGDLQTMKDPETRAGYWMKTIGASIMPKALMLLAYGGAFGTGGVEDEPEEPRFAEGLRRWGGGLWRMYQSVPTFELLNFFVVPWYRSEKSGDVVYLRMPQDDAGRVISGVLFATFKALRDSYDVEYLTTAADMREDAEGVSPLGQIAIDMAWSTLIGINYAGQSLPTLTPSIGVPLDIYKYSQASNVMGGEGPGPYDPFRGRHVLRESQLDEGVFGPDGLSAWGTDRSGGSLAPFLGYVWNQVGGGIFYRYINRTQYSKLDKDGLERFIELPGLSNMNRFIRAGRYGDIEKIRQAQDVPRRYSAAIQHQERAVSVEEVRKAIDAANSGGMGQRERIENHGFMIAEIDATFANVMDRLYPLSGSFDSQNEPQDWLSEDRYNVSQRLQFGSAVKELIEGEFQKANGQGDWMRAVLNEPVGRGFTHANAFTSQKGVALSKMFQLTPGDRERAINVLALTPYQQTFVAGSGGVSFRAIDLLNRENAQSLHRGMRILADEAEDYERSRQLRFIEDSLRNQIEQKIIFYGEAWK